MLLEGILLLGRFNYWFVSVILLNRLQSWLFSIFNVHLFFLSFCINFLACSFEVLIFTAENIILELIFCRQRNLWRINFNWFKINSLFINQIALSLWLSGLWYKFSLSLVTWLLKSCLYFLLSNMLWGWNLIKFLLSVFILGIRMFFYSVYNFNKQWHLTVIISMNEITSAFIFSVSLFDHQVSLFYKQRIVFLFKKLVNVSNKLDTVCLSN